MNNYAIATSDLASSLTQSASALQLAGNSLEQSTALITAGNTILQDPSTVSTAMKVISLRIRGVTSDLKEMGEETDDVLNKSKLQAKIKALTGVDLVDATGQFRSTYDILVDIGEVYDKLDSMSQASVLELLAGKTRANALAAVIQNVDVLKDAYASALDSSGSATRELNVYMDSIQGKLDQFTNAVQTMWNNFLDDDVIKWFVDLGTSLIKIIDSFGLFGTTLAAITVIKFIPWLLKSIASVNTFGGALNVILKPLVQVSSSGQTLKKVFEDAALAAIDSGKATTMLGANISGTGAALKAFFSTPLGWFTLFAAAVGVVIHVVDVFTVSIKEASEATKEAMTAYTNAQNTLRNHSKTIDEIKDDYAELAKGVDDFGQNISLSTEEYKKYNEITNKIADMFPTMVSGYTAEGNAIIAMKGNVEELTKAYEAEAQAARDAVVIKSEDIFYNFKNNTTDAGSIWTRKYNKLEDLQYIEDLLDGKLDNFEFTDFYGITGLERWFDAAGIDGYFWKRLFGDIDDYMEILNDEQNLSKLQSYYRQLKTEIDTETVNIKPIINAYLGNDFDYAKLSSEAKNAIQQIINGFDTEFYSQFDSASEMESWISTNLIQPLKDATKASEFKLAFDVQTQWNNNEISANEYQQKINDFLQILKQLGFDEDIIKSVTILFNTDDITTKQNIVKELLSDEYDYMAGTLSQEDLDIVDKYKSEWQLDNGILYSWDELLQKIEQAKQIADTSSITDSLSKIKSLEEAYDSLGDAIQKFKEDGFVDASTLESLNETFKDVDGFEELYKVLITGAGDVNQAISNVANAYIAQKGILSDLSEDEKQIMIARLKSLGVINAEEVFQVKQKAQEELNALGEQYSIDLTNYATAEEAKLAITQQMLPNIASIEDDQIKTLAEKYNIDLKNYATIAEQKIAIAREQAKEIAALNRTNAITDLNKYYVRSERNRQGYKDKLSQIESDYRAAIAAIPSEAIFNNVKTIVDNAYNKLKFDFSDSKIGIGSNYKDTISDKVVSDALEKLQKKYERQISHLSNQQQYLENEIEKAEAKDEVVGKAVYEEQKRLEQQKIDLYKKEKNELLALMSKTAKGSDEWYEMADAVWELEHNIQESTLAIIEFDDAITQLYVDAFDKIKTAFGNKQDFLDDQQAYIEALNEYRDLIKEPMTKSSIVELIDIESKKMADNEKQLMDLRFARDEALHQSSMNIGDDEWVQMESDIRAAEKAILDNKKAIEEYKKEIKDLYQNYFEKFEQAFDRLSDLFSRRGNYIEKQIDILNESEQQVTRGYYDALIANANDELTNSQQRLAQAQQNLTDAMNDGVVEEGTEEWWDLQTAVFDASDAIQDSELSILQYKNAIKDLYVEGFSKIETGFSNLGDLFADQRAYIEKYNELLGLRNEVVTEDSYNRMLEIENINLQNNEAALQALIVARDEAMDNGQIQAGSEAWIDMESKIRDAEAAILDSQIAVEQLNKEIQQLYVDTFAKINESFGNKNDILSSQQDYINGYIDNLNVLNIDVPQEVYYKLIEVEEQKRADNVDNLIQARAHIADLEAKGLTAADQEWVDATKKAIELEKAIQDNDSAILQWQQDIHEMDFSKFDDFMNRIGNVKSEMEQINDLMSHDDVAFEDGSWTKEGITALAMLYQQMETTKAQTQKYAEEIDKLNQLYDDGELSEKEYYERMQTLKDGQWESINTYENLKDSIVDMNSARIDMIEKGLNKEIEAYDELIDMKKKELDAERDLYEFKKNTEKQTKNIAELQRKIASLSGSTAASDIAQRRQLEARLYDAQQELNDSYYSRSKDQQSQALDEENNMFSKIRTDALDDMREKLEDIDAVVTESMNALFVNADIVLGSLNDISTEYGINISSNLISPWVEASNSAIAFKNSIDNVVGTMNNEDGVITLFGYNTAQALNGINVGFANTSMSAAQFSDAVALSVSNIENAIGSENAGFTQKISQYLSYPWDDMVSEDGPLTTFSNSVIEALNEAIVKAETDYETMKTSLERPWDEASLETFKQDVVDTLNGVIETIIADYNSIKDPAEQPFEDANPFLFSDRVTDAMHAAIDTISKAYKAMKERLEAPFNDASFSTFSTNIETVLDNAIAKVESAAIKIKTAMSDTVTIANNIGDTINNTSGSVKTNGTPTITTTADTTQPTMKDRSNNIKLLQEFLNKYWSSNLKIDGIYGSATIDAVKKVQKTIGATQDGKYGSNTVDALKKYYSNKLSVLNKLPTNGPLDTVLEKQKKNFTNARNAVPIALYAKGSLRTKKDQFAVTDESWIGEEITLAAGKNGQLQYLKKGSSIMPADISANLIEWGKLNPDMTNIMKPNSGVGVISNAINKPEFNISFDSLVHVDKCDEGTIKDLEKMVDTKINDFAKRINYAIKRY